MKLRYSLCSPPWFDWKEEVLPMLETSFIILSLVFLLLVAFSFPLFWQMWRTAKNMAASLESLNQSLPNILKNLEEITTNVSSATYMLKKEVEGLSLLGDKIRKITELGTDVERMLCASVKNPLWETFKTARALLKGLHVFFDVLYSYKESDI